MDPISRRNAPSGVAAKILACEAPDREESMDLNKGLSGISSKSFFTIINQPNPWFCSRHRFERYGSVKLRVLEQKQILTGFTLRVRDVHV